ncbi:hypothetical protein LTR91_012108 [Friedmanniomyces endolithicus]|uniref:Extracellular mutant protein 11 C-terminal domain-containing protein n=1 Tax=Friedmanniomyces endolithicus TaxID=329885 RepID=A0AAN6QR65_9PEZI|nr:hypothetical protein LTR35_002371 [Friedmanniomyces endolithicus]KAK0295867.1 hypothetical protein LTS00_005608 [Friedmanniomyces endolithicus]KAK0916213.1 hypothetical protein LTR57_013105 [Friedmanniomyces endolithicus]KAK0980717.1 hypothetical protein LTR91_012108 [Friedmanniomyces endolithicus]KAK0982564.1 hypothetical protein LTS01_011297 [Friedmanniomyces endolithicus]
MPELKIDFTSQFNFASLHRIADCHNLSAHYYIAISVSTFCEASTASRASGPGQHAAEAERVHYNEFKAPVTLPNSSTARTRSRQKVNPPTGVTQLLSKKAQSPPGARRPFYDTDASSIGDTSTITSAPATRAAAEPVKPVMLTVRHAAHPRSDGDDSLASDEEYETDRDHDDDDDNLPTDPLQDLDSQRKQPSQQQVVSGGYGRKPGGSGLPYMKGDSYPTTTDGIPSVSDVAERRHPHVDAHGMLPPTIAQMKRYEQPSAVQGPHAQNHSQRLLAEQRKVQMDQQYEYFETPASTQPPVEQQINSGFSFHRPGLTKPPKAMQDELARDSQPCPQDAASTDAAQMGSTDTDGGLPKQRTATGPASQRRTEVAAPHLQRQNPQPSLKNRPVTPDEQPGVERVNQHVKTAHKSQELPGVVHAHHEPLHGPELQLDYDIPELYGMKYKDLKAADFDRHPKAEHSDTTDGSLEHKMHAASAMVPEDQARFLGTLDINQWEEAGDWFLSRFGETMGKLKSTRQEKRQAACAFEDEIERRHSTVSKKRRVTEDALGEMKASGAMVLQGTPNKVKKTK